MAHRIDGDGVSVDENGAGKDGFTQTPPNETQVTADWLNDMQETVYQYIESRGIALVKGTFTQLISAIATHFPASSTDNAVARFDSTTGKIVQNSVVTVSDAGAVAGVTTLVTSGDITAGDDMVATGDFDFTSLRTGYLELELPRQGPNWNGGAGSDLTSASLNAYAYIPVTLPRNYTIAEIDAIVTPISARSGTNRMLVELEIRRQDYDSPYGVSTFSAGGDYGGTGTSKEKITSVIGYSVGTDATKNDRLYVAIRSGIGGSTGDTIHAVRVKFTYLGLRIGQ